MAANNKKTVNRIKIDKFLGINETDGGQTVLKNGESPYMRNFRIDDNGKLQKRFGWERIFDPIGYPIETMSFGKIDGEDKFYFIANNGLYLFNPQTGAYSKKVSISGDGEYFRMFYFKNKFYVLTSGRYCQYDGKRFSNISGYCPCLKKNTKPDGSGPVNERPNILTEYRKQLFSPDGVSKVFYLAEKKIGSVAAVMKNGDQIQGYTVNESDGTITFSSAPEAGNNTIEVLWQSKQVYADANLAVMGKMRNVAADCGGERIFMWGNDDCPNRLYWCGITEHGPRPDYFCEDCSAVIGSGEYAITDVIQHYDKIIIFTEGDAWCAQIKEKTASDGSNKYTEFNIWPINKDKGLKIIGGAQLIKNNPFSVMPDGVYEWTSTRAGDERNANLISQRVSKTIACHDVSSAVTFDDEKKGEYWLAFSDGQAVIYNYRLDAWYVYDGLPIHQFIKANDTVYFSTPDGSVCKFNEEYTDDGNPIECEWQMNFEGFGLQYANKNLLRAYVGLEPEIHAEYKLRWQTDSDCSAFYSDSDIAGSYDFFAYDDIRYDSFSYDTLYTPKVFRHRLMLKRFSYVKLYINNNKKNKGCTLVCLILEGYPSGEPKEQI